MAKTEIAGRKSPAGILRLYTLDVLITDGPMTEAFIKANPVISRTIQIRGDQSLDDLHGAIFAAFDREEEHLYLFQLGGKEPMDPNARYYEQRSPGDEEEYEDGRPPRDALTARMDALGLKVGQPFGYMFDFGDEWWHQINVAAIGVPAPRARYPKVVKRIGASPPQYMELEEEDE